MKNFIIGTIFGVALLIGAVWYFSDKNTHAEKAKEGLRGAAAQTKEFVQEKLGASHLSPEEIKDEFARTGKIVRQKAQAAGAAVADAATDTRITSTIKAKLVRDPDLSAISISVSTTGGRVTLSGTASSPGNIRKAIELAMETDGVHEVVSTLQVKS